MEEEDEIVRINPLIETAADWLLQKFENMKKFVLDELEEYDGLEINKVKLDILKMDMMKFLNYFNTFAYPLRSQITDNQLPVALSALIEEHSLGEVWENLNDGSRLKCFRYFHLWCDFLSGKLTE